MPIPGYKHSRKSIKKIKAARSRQILTKERNKKISRAMKGRKPKNFKKFIAAAAASNLGRRHSLKTRKKMSLSHRGSKSHLWRGGKTKLSRSIRRCFLYREWRSKIFARDGGRCVLCGSTKKLETDHHPIMFYHLLKEEKINSVEEALSCARLWNLDGGRLLCYKCHRSNTFPHPPLA